MKRKSTFPHFHSSPCHKTEIHISKDPQLTQRHCFLRSLPDIKDTHRRHLITAHRQLSGSSSHSLTCTVDSTAGTSLRAHLRPDIHLPATRPHLRRRRRRHFSGRGTPPRSLQTSKRRNTPPLRNRVAATRRKRAPWRPSSSLLTPPRSW